jgi:hypothetical protein
MTPKASPRLLPDGQTWEPAKGRVRGKIDFAGTLTKHSTRFCGFSKGEVLHP